MVGPGGGDVPHRIAAKYVKDHLGAVGAEDRIAVVSIGHAEQTFSSGNVNKRPANKRRDRQSKDASGSGGSDDDSNRVPPRSGASSSTPVDQSSKKRRAPRTDDAI